MNLPYLVPRIMRHFLPEGATRFLLLRSMIIKPGMETANAGSAVVMPVMRGLPEPGGVPEPSGGTWVEKGGRKQTLSWVTLDSSLQWRFFSRAAASGILVPGPKIAAAPWSNRIGYSSGGITPPTTIMMSVLPSF